MQIECSCWYNVFLSVATQVPDLTSITSMTSSQYLYGIGHAAHAHEPLKNRSVWKTKSFNDKLKYFRTITDVNMKSKLFPPLNQSLHISSQLRFGLW